MGRNGDEWVSQPVKHSRHKRILKRVFRKGGLEGGDGNTSLSALEKSTPSKTNIVWTIQRHKREKIFNAHNLPIYMELKWSKAQLDKKQKKKKMEERKKSEAIISEFFSTNDQKNVQRSVKCISFSFRRGYEDLVETVQRIRQRSRSRARAHAMGFRKAIAQDEKKCKKKGEGIS